LLGQLWSWHDADFLSGVKNYCWFEVTFYLGLVWLLAVESVVHVFGNDCIEKLLVWLSWCFALGIVDQNIICACVHHRMNVLHMNYSSKLRIS